MMMNDLGPRLKTSVILILVYGLSLYFGGLIFILVILSTLILMSFELTKLISFKNSPTLFLLALLILFFSVFTLTNAGLNDKKILLFIVTVVVITDIFGFVFGRLFGGPKVMPSISPGKTWSGIVFGWFGSALVGFFYTLIFVPGGFGVIAAIFLSIFAQSGDFAESFLKRRAKVKNSSELLPGHGGFLDRFDGMVGASLFYGLVLFWIQ